MDYNGRSLNDIKLSEKNLGAIAVFGEFLYRQKLNKAVLEEIDISTNLVKRKNFVAKTYWCSGWHRYHRKISTLKRYDIHHIFASLKIAKDLQWIFACIHNRMYDDIKGSTLGGCLLGFLTMKTHSYVHFYFENAEIFSRLRIPSPRNEISAHRNRAWSFKTTGRVFFYFDGKLMSFSSGRWNRKNVQTIMQ